MRTGDISMKVIREWVGDDIERADQFAAFLAGFNVGHECAESDRARDMTEREFTKWQIEMFESKVEE